MKKQSIFQREQTGLDQMEVVVKSLRPGRPVSINKHTLKCRPGKDYAEVLFFGDLHLGYPTTLLDKAKANLEYCVEKGIYVLGMGDLMECGTTSSIGDSVYQQKLNPHSQMEEVISLLAPVAKAGLLLGLLKGNHEDRISNATSINVTKIICGFLDVPYLFSARWSWFKVGKQNYTVYAIHGSTGSRFSHTKLKAAIDASRSFRCDVFATGHTHDMISDTIEEQMVDYKNKIISYHKKLVIVTGHYLGYDMSYAQMKGYQMGKVGSPKVKFFRDEHDYHLSI